MPLEESDFKEKALKKAKIYAEGIQMSDLQFKIYMEVVRLVHKFIPIGIETLKGIGWKAMLLWQKDYNIKFVETIAMNHEERIQVLTRYTDYVRIELVANLINSEYEEKVTEAINQALEYYDSKYANI
jgi:hypothetical protein